MSTDDKELLDVFPVIGTDRLDLIEIKQNHLSDLFTLFGDDHVTKFYNIKTLAIENEAQPILDWFQSRFEAKLGIRWGIALKGEEKIIGTIGFNNFTKKHRANLGYDLQTKHWNKGYITEAIEAAIDFGFNQLEINRIEAEVMQGNVASEKVLSKLGFSKEGVLRQWMFWNGNHYDMVMYSLLKEDFIKKKIRKANSCD